MLALPQEQCSTSRCGLLAPDGSADLTTYVVVGVNGW